MPLTSGLGSAALTPSGYGMRNAIINGDFSIDQRNGGNQQVITAGAALAYTVDRWYSYCTGANIAVRQQTASVPLRFRYQMAGSSGNTGAFLGQRIEAANSYHFAGKVAALSVYLQSSTITSVNWAVYRANTTDTFGTVASPTRTLIASGSLPVTSTMTRQSVFMDIPTAATTGLEIVFSVPSLGGLDILFLGNVQFEANPQVTPFEQRPIGVELALCQRYYERFNGTPPGTGYYNTTSAFFIWPYKVRKRSDPAHNMSALGNWVIYAISAGIALNSVTYEIADNLDSVSIRVATNAATQGVCAILYPQNTSAWIEADSEL